MPNNALLTVSLIAGLTVPAPALAAQTDFRHLTPAERALLGDEIRQVLRADPDLVRPAFEAPIPTPGYQDEIDQDRDLLTRLADQIWATPVAAPTGAPKLAVITAPDCAPCDAVLDQLTSWAQAGRVDLYTLPMNDAAAHALGLDTAPSFIFETMIVRGDVPPVVLEKYLSRQ